MSSATKPAFSAPEQTGVTRPAVLFCAIAGLALLAYLPMLWTFFISDDFVYLTQIRMVLADPRHLLHIPPGFYRLTGHLYFLLCYKLFGLHPAGYHAIGLLLHITASLLVYVLVIRISGSRQAGGAAALFFTVYERHHEAVLWISAASELTATISVLVCVLFWHRFLRAAGAGRWLWYAAAVLAFAVALFSKESAVVVTGILLLLLLVGREYRGLDRAAFAAWLPVMLASVAYLRVVSAGDPIVQQGFYAVGGHFFRVYLKTLNTLLLFVWVATVVWVVALGWRQLAAVLREHARPMVFSLGWLLITPVPFCFVTYVDQAPSRQTYLPSVGTAAIVGLLAAALLRSTRGRRAIAAICALVLLGNAAYIWKKDVRFERRAEPTRVLLDTLKGDSAGAGKVYVICNSEYYEVVSRSAVELFAPQYSAQLTFIKPADANDLRLLPADFVMQWDDRREAIRVVRRPERH